MIRGVVNGVRVMPRTRSQTLNVVRSLTDGNYQLQHDEKRRKLYLQLDPETTAWIDYKRLANNEVLLYHTDVPKKYGGKGIGNILAKETFKFFEDRNDKMKITCTFLQKIRDQMNKK